LGIPVNNYVAFGLNVESELPLVELPVATPQAGLPGVTIRVADFEPTIPGAIEIGALVQATPDDFLLNVPDVARYRVRGGVDIAIMPAPGTAMVDVRLHLLGTVFGVLCYQRGLQPMHANAVEVGGRCFAFAGPSGSGKSTLAAVLDRRGYHVLCDDLCVLSFEPDGGVLVWPGLPQFKLWKDAVSWLGHDATALERAIGGREKYRVPNAGRTDTVAIPIRGLYTIGKAKDDHGAEIRRLTGTEAIGAFVRNVYRPRLVGPLGKERDVHRRALTFVRQAGVYAFERRDGLNFLARDVDLIEQHFADRDP
jgi:hypothetical protein